MAREPATLLGLAIGDALGMPFETHPKDSTPLLSWDGSFQSGATNDLQKDRQPGEWTDDTMMSLALTESLLECGAYNPVHACAKYVEWYKGGDLRGIGKATRGAMDRLLQGHHWNNSGIEHAEGNGTVMRIAPLGLYYRRSLITVADMARVDACLTHRSLEAQEGSVAIAIGVAALAEGLSEKGSVLSPVLNMLQGGTDGFTTYVEARLLELQKWLKEPRTHEEAVQRLLEVGTKAKAQDTVHAAFLCFLTTDSFKDAVEMAVRAGGDTDTTAAVTGALAGTYYGLEQVAPYLEELEGAEHLHHLGHLLFLEAPRFPEEP